MGGGGGGGGWVDVDFVSLGEEKVIGGRRRWSGNNSLRLL